MRYDKMGLSAIFIPEVSPRPEPQPAPRANQGPEMFYSRKSLHGGGRSW
jgi:hypothetical protein